MSVVQTCRKSVSFVALAFAAGVNAQNVPDARFLEGQPIDAPAHAARIDEAALTRAQAKFAHALAVTHRFDAQAASGGRLDEAWRFELAGHLMKMSEENFAKIESATDLTDAFSKAAYPAASQSTTASSGAKSLGAPTTDLVYVPITPCRIADSRLGGGPLPTKTAKLYTFTSGNAGASACSVTSQIPGTANAAAFATNVTVDETGLTGFPIGSFLRIYPQGSSTNSSFVNFGPNDVVANAGVVTINQSNGEFQTYSNAPTQVIIDVYGVFIAPQPTAETCTLAFATQTIPAGFSAMNYNSATCATGTTALSPYCFSYAATSSGSGINGTGPFCGWVNSSGADATVYQGAMCCSIPGR